MKKFEYYITTGENITEYDLNEYGKNGWELVAIYPTNNSGEYQMIFKREIKPDL